MPLLGFIVTLSAVGVTERFGGGHRVSPMLDYYLVTSQKRRERSGDNHHALDLRLPFLVAACSSLKREGKDTDTHAERERGWNREGVAWLFLMVREAIDSQKR